MWVTVKHRLFHVRKQKHLQRFSSEPLKLSSMEGMLACWHYSDFLLTQLIALWLVGNLHSSLLIQILTSYWELMKNFLFRAAAAQSWTPFRPGTWVLSWAWSRTVHKQSHLKGNTAQILLNLNPVLTSSSPRPGPDQRTLYRWICLRASGSVSLPR